VARTSGCRCVSVGSLSLWDADFIFRSWYCVVPAAGRLTCLLPSFFPVSPPWPPSPQPGQAGAHELKHDGYRLQIPVRARVHLYTINGVDWSKRYPLIVEDAVRIEGCAIFDAEVVWLDSDGVANFEALHGRHNDARATACVFDLLMLNGDDLRKKPLSERKAMLRKVLRRAPTHCSRASFCAALAVARYSRVFLHLFGRFVR
jgi:ATP-dependent DNA ligase